jgi:hypothetical protein
MLPYLCKLRKDCLTGLGHGAMVLTWDTINEVQGRAKKSESVDKININGSVETDPLKIATEFNSFFTRVGKQISNSIPPVHKAPEEYVNYNRQIPNMLLGNTTPAHIKK